MSIINRLAQGMQHRITSRIEDHHMVNKDTVRVVASFNRNPNEVELRNQLAGHFNRKLEPVKNSFTCHKKGNRILISGFMVKGRQTRPLEEQARLKEIAKNVYMDDQDSSIWTTVDNMLVKTVKEDLSEIASTVRPQPVIKNKPEEGLRLIPKYEGSSNTQFMKVFDVITSSITYGCRVNDNHIYSDKLGVVEVAQNTVVDYLLLKGMDKVSHIEVSSTSTEGMIEYYRKLLDYDPEYFRQMEKIIDERAVL